MQEVVERAQQRRDLKAQLGNLDREDEQEIIFKETSPPRRMYTIYSMIDGEPLSIPFALVDRTLDKRQRDGSFMFTARKEEAPEYKLGTVKCFLHPESPYRTSGMLEEAGLASQVCYSAHHPSKYAMEEVARSKHRKQWAALEAHIADQKEQVQEARQERQLEATLALAGQAAKAPDVELVACGDCEYTGSPNQLKGHRMHHKAAAPAE